MLDGGEDPRYIARRVLRMAVEDIGLADPHGLTVALSAWKPMSAWAARKANWRSPRLSSICRRAQIQRR